MELKSARERAGTSNTLGLNSLFKHVAATPATHSVKGMFLDGVWRALDSAGITGARSRIHAFRDYPLTEYMELLLDASITLCPERPARYGLMRLGRLVVPTFSDSIVGGVLMSTVGRNWEMALKFVSKGYEVSLKPGSAHVTHAGARRAILHLRDVWAFGDSFQVGIVQGLLEWCDLEGRVTPKGSGGEWDLELEW